MSIGVVVVRCVGVVGPTSARRLNITTPSRPGLESDHFREWLWPSVWPTTTTGLGEQKHWRDNICYKISVGENRELMASLHKSCPH